MASTKPHSLKQILYFGTGVATPIAHGKGFSINTSSQFADQSSWGDTFQTQKPGLIQATAQLLKHYDHAEESIHEASQSNLLGNFYWYPDRGVPGDYWYWTGYITGGGPQGGSLNEIIGQTYDIVFETQPVKVVAS